MSTTAIGRVIDALVTAATTALAANTAVYVSDGVPVTSDPRDFLMIGVDDPTTSNPTSGSAEQVKATMGTPRTRDETGRVICAAYSSNGNGPEGQKPARDAALTYMAALETALRTDPTLGLGQPGYTDIEVGGATSLAQGQDENGADALLIFTVNYKIRI